MAVDTPSIARPLAPSPSLNYEQLFLQGIQHIEKLSGKIWTDYNAHDPGITILEVLSYAITELGYRCDFAMGELVEPSPESAILNEFFSLANVATNAPLTIDDYRKLLIDLDRVKNAWLEKVTFESVTGQPADTDPNAHLYVHYVSTGYPEPAIDNTPPIPNDPPVGRQILIQGLYDVFLRLEEHPEYGDLNDLTIKTTMDVEVTGLGPRPFDVSIEFQEWQAIDHADAEDLQNWVSGSHPSPVFTVWIVTPTELAGEEFAYEFRLKIEYGSSSMMLVVVIRLVSNQELIVNRLDFFLKIQDAIHGKFYDGVNDSDPVVRMVLDFLAKRAFIIEYLTESKEVLANHRNLCEDFRAVHPMSLQQIGLQVDLDVAPGTDRELVMAKVYYATQEYLSPTIRFYSLREMLEKGYAAEEIFRGPWLLNGFIDENDLSFYQRREILYTSDLIQEFMKIEGVRAVNHIALSRYEGGKVATGLDGEEQRNLLDCLCLKNPARYLPILSYDRSQILMNSATGKPSQPDMANALKLLSELHALDTIKGQASQGDFDIPVGTYSHLGDYHSIQHEFPLNYAIGIEGLASTEPDLRKAQAQQLKGYLLFFEQLLGNFLAQIENLRKLFSYSDDIDRTYFTQALYMVPRVDALIRDYAGNPLYSSIDFEDYIELSNPTSEYYALKLDALAERNPVFQDRRKRFLDHLLGRFNESFSEYAAYVFGKGITKAEKYNILIQDQSRFLRNYVMHSHDRGTGFNYQLHGSVDSNWYWRAGTDVESLNLGTGGEATFPTENPDFVDPYEEFDIYKDGSGNFRFRLYDANGVNMLHSITGHANESLLRDDLKLVVAQGQTVGNYTIGASTTLGTLAKVGAAYINSYNGNATAAVEALALYLTQLATVDELPVENAAGHTHWQGVNDVTGLKKRMVFLAGMPNLNRQYINPFSRFVITQSGPDWTYSLLGDEGAPILASVPGSPFATEDDLLAHLLLMFENLDTLVINLVGLDPILQIPGGPPTSIGKVASDFINAYIGLPEATVAMVAYLRGLYQIENLHVVEHILLRQRASGEPTLEPRIDGANPLTYTPCPALDIEDPYSFRISVILPMWAGRFTEQTFRTWFKRTMRAEAPAHVYINFYWIDPLQMRQFEEHWAAWLDGGWESQGLDSMAECLNDLRNLLDAQYYVEPLRIKDDYDTCEVVAAPYDPDGDIVRAILAPGFTLPEGLCLDPCSGAIRVTDVEALKLEPDSFDLEIMTINAGGEEVWHEVHIEFQPNGNATLNGGPILTQNQCFYNQQVLPFSFATFTDPNGISLAEVMSWTITPGGYFGSNVMPAGFALNSITGEITVVNPSLIIAGDYHLDLRFEDTLHGVTYYSLDFTITPNDPAVASVALPKNEDAYANLDVLATITDPSSNLSAVPTVVSGPSLATMGLELYAASYPAASVDVRVTAPSSTFKSWLTSGSSAITISGGYYHFTLHLDTQDSCGGQSLLDIPISVYKDHEASFVPVPTINVSLHNVGSALGRITDTLDGGLVSNATLLNANNAALLAYGIEMYYYNTSDPDEARLRVLNKATFTTKINTTTADPYRVATLVIPLQTEDTTGGLSTVNAVIKAKQNFPPVITVETAQHVDSYTQYEVLATIKDNEGTGIVSATHVVSGFTLASIGLQMRYQGGYPGYQNNYQNSNSNFNRNMGMLRSGTNFGLNLQGQNNNYQSLPQPLYYQGPTYQYVEIVVQNVGLFRQAVATNPAFVAVANTNLKRVSLVINTTDSLGGFASNAVDIDIIKDVEATMTEIMNGQRIDSIQGGHIMVRFEDLDPNTTFTGGTVTPSLPKGFSTVLGQNTFDIYVSNKNLLVPDSWPISVVMTDSGLGSTTFNLDLVVLPKLIKVNYTIAATQQGHVLNLDSKVSGLKITSLSPPYYPKSFGSISLNNGVQIGFDEGSSYGTSNYSMTVAFKGTLGKDNEPVDGEFTVGRQVVKTSGSTTKGQELLSGNPILSARMGSDTQLQKLADGTGYAMSKLHEVTYYPDNPLLRSNPTLMESYAAGSKDGEVTQIMKTLAVSTTKEILRTQEALRTSQGEARKAASQSLEAYAEVLRIQIMAAIHYAGNILENDITGTSGIDGLFESYRKLLANIFDGKSSSNASTELSKLRGTLRDVQDHYGSFKPNLEAAILKLLPAAPNSKFAALEGQMFSPFTGEINADLVTLLQEFRSVFKDIDTLFDDSGFRVQWREGLVLDQVASLLKAPMERLTGFIKNAEIRLKELPYGIQQLDLAHAHARAGDLLNIAGNALFELLDQLPNEIGDDPVLIGFTEFLSEQFNAVSSQAALGEFRKTTSSWSAKWPLKPMLSTPTGSSLEVARLQMQPPRVMDRYKTGDTLGAVVMVSGTLATISVSKGLLPRGLSLSSDGRIWISDVKLITLGIFGGLELSGTNDRGFAFTLIVPDIEFFRGSDTVYYVEAPMPLDSYVDGFLLAYPSDPDGTIASAQIQYGSMPPGVRFDTETGNFSVAKASKLVKGIYAVEVLTEDDLGGLTTEKIKIEIGLSVPNEINLSFMGIQLPLSIGDVIATLAANGVSVTQAVLVSGRLPAGTFLNHDGTIVVTDNQVTNVGMTTFDVACVGLDLQNYLIHVTIEIVSYPIPVPIMVSGISLHQPLGAILASLQVTGQVIASYGQMSSILPPGCALSSSGDVIVDSPGDLQPGQYHFEIHGYSTTNADYHFMVDLGFATSRPGDQIFTSQKFMGIELPLFIDDNIGRIDGDGVHLSGVHLVGGSLPPNVVLLPDGNLVCVKGQGRLPGFHNFTVEGTGTDQAIYKVAVDVEFVDIVPSEQFQVSSFNINLPVKSGEVLGVIDADSVRLNGMEVIDGNPPAGISIDADGTVMVLDAQAVVVGLYLFKVVGYGSDGKSYEGEIRMRVG